MTAVNKSKCYDLRGLDRGALESLMVELGQPKYRATQVMRWLHQHNIDTLEQMGNVPQALRQALGKVATLHPLRQKRVQLSTDGTAKLLFQLHDGECIESVFIPDAAKQGRHALCISTQVGCAMGCLFCATGQLQLQRHLLASEIVEQVRLARLWLQQQDGEQRLGSLVFMGMGEPLHNYEAVVAAVRILTDPEGHGYSPRRITVSTAGLTSRLARLLDDVDVQIAVSLVAARDAVRSQLMPINKKYPVAQLLETCRQLPIKPRRRITFEVVLVAGVNDSDADAVALAKAVAQLRCKVNLIPFNPHENCDLRAPSNARVLAFQEVLRGHNVGAYLRQPRGQDIDAACGTLVAKDRDNAGEG